MASMTIRKCCAVFIFILILFPFSASAQEAKLTRITVSNTRDDLLLYFNLEGAFTEKLKEAVFSGVPATFSFYISLYRVRTLWHDKKIADIQLSHTIKYDNLKKEFTIKRSWKEEDTIVTQSFDEAQRYMTEIDSLAVYPLNRLSKGVQYQIKAMAEVSKITLPLYLHYVLVFVSFWDFETDWYTIDFIY
jgi:gamma-glutamyl phosphate reductase